ncbi:MAG: UDP-N-acetylmuramate--L-alanine ligase [Lachnospiraceae bacterium]
MYKIDFNQPIHVHFIGIGGISMSGLAEVLLQEGFTITGSDLHETPLTASLQEKGAAVFYGQRASNIEESTQLVVYTAAVHEDNEEYQAAKTRGIPMLTRADLLGQMMLNYKTPVAVAGTHGKTTTTSMISCVLLESGLDPTVSVGGILPIINGNIHVGKSDVFVTEACEYTNSYWSFHPKISIILNIDADHLDFFKNLSEIRKSFRVFAQKLPADGTLIINSDIPDYEEIIEDLACRVVTFALKQPADYTAENLQYDAYGNPSFTCAKNQVPFGEFSLKVPGLHNVANALATIALGDLLALDAATMALGLLHFTGTQRRFQHKGSIGGVTIIDDYAHHPTEIKATLTAAAKYPHKTLWCVFQPHTYTRTQALMDEFAEALLLADKIVLADIYAAREKNLLGVSSKDLQAKIQELGKECYYFPTFDEIEAFLLKNCVHDDLLITMGAGDVVTIGEDLLGQ